MPPLIQVLMTITKLESFIENSFKGFVSDPIISSKFEKLSNLVQTGPCLGANSSILSDDMDLTLTLSLNPHTRSRGPVASLPNVQPRILERRVHK